MDRLLPPIERDPADADRGGRDQQGLRADCGPDGDGGYFRRRFPEVAGVHGELMMLILIYQILIYHRFRLSIYFIISMSTYNGDCSYIDESIEANEPWMI